MSMYSLILILTSVISDKIFYKKNKLSKIGNFEIFQNLDVYFFHFFFMNSKEFVLQLNAKGYNATEIHEIIVQEMQDEALSYSAITKYIRSQSFVPNIQLY